MEKGKKSGVNAVDKKHHVTVVRITKVVTKMDETEKSSGEEEGSKEEGKKLHKNMNARISGGEVYVQSLQQANTI